MIKQKAIFLDRDGVLNKELGDYVSDIEKFEVLTYNILPLKKLYQQGYLLIVITNQGGIAKGLYSDEELALMHQKLKAKYATHQVYFTEIYYCRHQPQFVGKCLCRKPDSIMVEKAIARFNIDQKHSYFIGDKERDVICAEKAGVKGILIESNQPIDEVLQPMNLIQSCRED